MSKEQQMEEGNDQKMQEENDQFDEKEEDYEDDDDVDVGEAVSDEKLKEMGIDLDQINHDLNADIEDNRSWVSTSEVGEPNDDNMSEEEANVSVQSYSDKIRKVFLDHTDAIMALEIINGNVFTGGMDDRLVKWRVDKSEDSVDSKKVCASLTVVLRNCVVSS